MIKKVSYFFLVFAVNLNYSSNHNFVSPSYAPSSSTQRSSDLQSLASTILVSSSSSPQSSPEPDQQCYRVFPQIPDDQVPCWPQERIIELFTNQINNDIARTVKTLLQITGHPLPYLLEQTRQEILTMEAIPHSPNKSLDQIYTTLQKFGVSNITLEQSQQDNSNNPEIKISLFKNLIQLFPAFIKSHPNSQKAQLLHIAQYYKNHDFARAHVLKDMIHQEKENPDKEKAAKTQYEDYFKLCKLRASIQSLCLALQHPRLQIDLDAAWQVSYDLTPEECHEALDEFHAYLEKSKDYQTQAGQKRERSAK